MDHILALRGVGGLHVPPLDCCLKVYCKVYAMSFLLMLPTAGSYSFAPFTPTILSILGCNTALSQILTTLPCIFSAIVSISMGILADHLKPQSPFIVAHSFLAISASS